MKRKFCFFLPFTICVFSSAFAQLEKIDTDRPDQTESAVLTPKKWIQLEMGFIIQHNSKLENEFLLPTLLSKYGISKRIECRLITTYNCIKAMGINNITGLSPIELGSRIALTEEKKWMPKISLLLHLAIPGLSSKNFKINKAAPKFRFSMQHTLTDQIGLGYNLGAEWDGYNNQPTLIYTFAPGFNLNEKWYGYFEAYGFISRAETAQHNLDGGIAYYVNDNTKLDISSGFGISKTAPDWYFAIGASIRFKTGQ